MGEELLSALLGNMMQRAVRQSGNDDDDDDTGDPDFSKKYLDEWKVERHNVGTKLKEVLRAFRKVNGAGEDLLQNPSKYNAILQVVIRLPFQRRANPSEASRVKFLDALIREGLVSFYKTYWDRLKGQIGGWESLVLRSIGQATTNFGRSLTMLWSGTKSATEEHMKALGEFSKYLIGELDTALLKNEYTGMGNHQGMVVNAMIRCLYNMASKSHDAVIKIRSCRGVEIISHYIRNYKDTHIKTNSLMLLSCIAPPNHACIKLLEAEDKHMNYLMDQMDQAISSQGRFTAQYDLEELVPGVSNSIKISAVMNNKFSQLGAPALYVEMLDDSFSTNITKMALEGLNYMIGVDKVKTQVKTTENCREYLKHWADTGTVLCHSAQSVIDGLAYTGGNRHTVDLLK